MKDFDRIAACWKMRGLRPLLRHCGVRPDCAPKPSTIRYSSNTFSKPASAKASIAASLSDNLSRAIVYDQRLAAASVEPLRHPCRAMQIKRQRPHRLGHPQHTQVTIASLPPERHAIKCARPPENRLPVELLEADVPQLRNFRQCAIANALDCYRVHCPSPSGRSHSS